MTSSYASVAVPENQPIKKQFIGEITKQLADEQLTGESPKSEQDPSHRAVVTEEDAICTLQGLIKHPDDIPLNYRVMDQPVLKVEQAGREEVMASGMVFTTQHSVPTHTAIEIDITVRDECLTLCGVVKNCVQINEVNADQAALYEVAVCFREGHDSHTMRMVEQVCHIEHYHQAWLSKGRNLTADEAAKEWIGRFAPVFPQ